MLASTVVRNSAAETRASSLRFSEIYLANGVRLQYAEQGDADGVPVIMLHGYTDSWFSYSSVLPLLDASYRAFALSQRGHGDSARPEGAYAITDFAGDVIEFMDAVGIPSAVLVGHCMGSFIAQRVAYEAPHRVRKLLLVASATKLLNETTLGLLGEVEALADPVPSEFARAFQESTIYRPLGKDFVDHVVSESLKLPARVWRAVLKGQMAYDASAVLKDITVPTLVLWGERDAIFSRAEQEALVSSLPAAALKVYRETGHAPHWERPEQFVRDLKEFIGGAA